VVVVCCVPRRRLLQRIILNFPVSISFFLITPCYVNFTFLKTNYFLTIPRPKFLYKIGLYKSGLMYCTQCEAIGLLRITHYPDPKGMAQRDHVVSLVWQWIKLIRPAVESDSDGFMKKYHEELR